MECSGTSCGDEVILANFSRRLLALYRYFEDCYRIGRCRAQWLLLANGAPAIFDLRVFSVGGIGVRKRRIRFDETPRPSSAMVRPNSLLRLLSTEESSAPKSPRVRSPARLKLSSLARRDENRLAHRQSYLHVRCAHRLGQSEASHGSFPGAS